MRTCLHIIEIDGELIGKVVGRRQPRDGFSGAMRLRKTMNSLQEHLTSVPRGVFRFKTFEEADAWMAKMDESSPPEEELTTRRPVEEDLCCRLNELEALYVVIGGLL